MNTTANDNWLPYENPTNNFKLSYPLNWKRTGNENNITFFSPLNANDSFQENVNIIVSPSGNVPLYESASLAIIQYKQSEPNFRLLDFGGITIANVPAYKILYTAGNGTHSHKVLEIRSTIGDKLYLFIFTANLGDNKRYLNIINRILGSLEIQVKQSN